LTIATGKYQEWLAADGLTLLEGWAREGLTDEQISKKAGICRDTLYRWMREHPDISDAIKKGKAPVDMQVENALLKSALGHVVKIRKPIKVRTKKQLKDKGTIEEEHIEYAEEEVYIPPQTVAQLFWLKNRRPDRWREKPAEAASVTEEDLATDGLTAALMEEAAGIMRENGGNDGAE
jgi:transposase-like protein